MGLEKEGGSMNEVTEETAIELNFQTKNRFCFFFFFRAFSENSPYFFLFNTKPQELPRQEDPIKSKDL